MWDMEYADDTIMMCRDPDILEELLHILEKAARVGLLLNHSKCEHMQVNSVARLHFRTQPLGQCECPRCSTNAPIQPGRLVPTSTLVKYLGIYLAPNSSPTQDMSRRIGKAYGASKLLAPFFKNKSLPNDWKVLVYRQVIQSIVLYASESTTMTQAFMNKMDALHFRVLRQIFGYKSTYYHRVLQPTATPASNEWIHSEMHRLAIKAPTLTQLASQRRQKLFGHMFRHPESPEYQACFNNIGMFRRISNSKFRVGAPRIHWPEMAMVEAYSRIQQLGTGYHPHWKDYGHAYFKTPDKTAIYNALGTSVHSFYDSTTLLRIVRPAALDRNFWKTVVGR